LKKYILFSAPMVKSKPGRLDGIKILVTAGPTHEKIDPVRYISNYSSGRMGFAIAECCAEEGAAVLLVSGPVNLETNHPGINRFDVTSAEEMAACCFDLFGDCRAGIMTAAVADYTPARSFNSKLKRTTRKLSIELVPTTDIAAELGRRKRVGQVLVGFALETGLGEADAKNKLKYKNLDFIVLNSLKDKGAGFGSDTNKITIIDADNNIRHFELKSKREVAKDIIEKLVEYV
jgi:phosphopantothenoylcysteine decarboxylase/phosphopantothenate--cysteine ligase